MQASTLMSASPSTPALVAPHTGEAVWFTNYRMTLKATAESTGGAYGLVEALASVGSGPPLHVHSREDEAFWILEGTLAIRCGETTFEAGAGSFTFLPRGIPHTFAVVAGPARILSICTPGGFERFFVDAGRPADTDGLPEPGSVDVATLARISGEYGVQFVGPPLSPDPSPLG